MGEQLSEDAGRIARALVEARRSATGLADYPGTPPADLDAAYAIQDAARALAGGSVAGWKIGRINPPLGGIDRLAGPIFADKVVQAGADPVAMAVFADGFAAAEAEFLLRIGTAPDPARTSYTHEAAAALIDAVHVGIEVASSPYVGINGNGAPVTVSDFGNNNGLVIGAAVPDWRTTDLTAIPVALAINGDTVGEATAATMLDGPIGAARFLFELAASRGFALRPGQWISSGAVTGVHRVAVGDGVVAMFGATTKVTCRIAKA